jgi:uncharacterized lipoprotein YddW (UPF0748 family)
MLAGLAGFPSLSAALDLLPAADESRVDLAKLRLFAGAERIASESSVLLPEGAHAEWQPERPLTTDGGTLSLWVRPLWAAGDDRSHTFLSFKWTVAAGSPQSYFALSQGWWEPTGARKLYAVVSNQEFAFCLMPWSFDYTLYLPGQWTMVTVAWQAGHPGYVRLFVDGKIVCDRSLNFAGGRTSREPVDLGSDRATGLEPLGRPAQVAIKELIALPKAWSVAEVRTAYLRGGGSERPKWAQAIAAAAPQSKPAHERRIMQDEDTRWASSRTEILRRVSRTKAAGFNIYMPNVWNGALAYFATDTGHAAFHDAADPEYDPLAYLLEAAHRQGLEVHAWFIIGRNPGGSVFPESFTAGAPPDAFNIQSTGFRDFIVHLVLDVAKRYDLDGINLDYIRAMGACSNPQCAGAYLRRYGRSIQEDWDAQQQGRTIASLIDWNRAATTDIVSRIASGLKAMRSRAIVTIDTVPFDHSREHQGLDEAAWLRNGWVNSLVYMAYDDPIDVAGIDRAMAAFSPARLVVNVRDYDWCGTTAIDRSGDAMQDYVRLIRARWPGAGIGFYHYMHLTADQLGGLSRGSFNSAAEPGWAR